MNILWILILITVFAGILMYNFLIARKNQVANIFGSIDALLKKRYDLIPNLVASVKEYMKHEKEILEKITQLRSRAIKSDLLEDEKLEIDKEITDMLHAVLVSVENYPELKANENVLHLQAALNEIEEQISAARRAYNQAVTDYNNAIEMFPTNIIAGFLGYRPKKIFEADNRSRKNVDVKELFDRQ
ncbi:LemA family protein [Nitrosophilus alvini]|uniref:LemA family protein n=1 Tax=Nitrosophilus alvini TaxID=2714855 RepID=UPI00190AB96B|nr:LemA family protein [Nitrosophilus alvini]